MKFNYMKIIRSRFKFLFILLFIGLILGITISKIIRLSQREKRTGEDVYFKFVNEHSVSLQQLRKDVLSKTAIMNKWVLKIMKGIDAEC